MIRDLYIHDTAATGVGCGHPPPICVASRVEGAWIRSNRIWDNQEHRTQNEELHVADGGECKDCRIED